LTSSHEYKGSALLRGLISRTFGISGEAADPFTGVIKAKKYLIDNIDLVKTVLAAKGIVHEHNLLIKLLNDEASSFLASKVMQPVNTFIDNCNFKFFGILANEGTYSVHFIRERVYFIFKNSFFLPETELFLKSSCNIFRYHVIDKYVPEIFSKEGDFWYGLKNEFDYPLSVQDWVDFIKTVFLIRPMVYAKMLSLGSEFVKIERSNNFIKRYSKEFSPLPGVITGEAFKSFLCADGVSGGFLSRLVYIFDMMYRVQPWPEKYTGAEEPHEKSWIFMAMINSSFYGFDKTILEELYSIAGDKNW
jgi:hypothetical protein